MKNADRVDAVVQPVLLFDGECGLCQRVVRLLLRIDRRGCLQYAPLQSPPAQEFLRRHGLPTEDFETIVFVPDWKRRERPDYLLRTEGAVAALRAAGGVGRWLALIRFVPVQVRDAAYRLIGRWRYRLFGVWQPRALARPEWRERFLDNGAAH